MYKYHCLNPISQVGLDQLTEEYTPVERGERSRCDSGQKRCYA